MDTNGLHLEQLLIFLFSTPEHHVLCWKILEAYLAYKFYNVQIKGICKVLNNVNLLTILATGMKKTQFFIYVHTHGTSYQEGPGSMPHCKVPKQCMHAGDMSNEISGGSNGEWSLSNTNDRNNGKLTLGRDNEEPWTERPNDQWRYNLWYTGARQGYMVKGADRAKHGILGTWATYFKGI